MVPAGDGEDTGRPRCSCWECGRRAVTVQLSRTLRVCLTSFLVCQGPCSQAAASELGEEAVVNSSVL